MLRNSSSAAGAASQLLKMMYGYRSYKIRASARSILYLLACAVIFLLWTLCGLYAPYVYTRTGSDVLLAESPYCGFALPQVSDSTNGGDTFNMFQKRDIDLVSSADAYVQQCYNESSATSAQCSTFPKQSLQYRKTVVGCPFGANNDLCVTVNSSTIQLDTGLLDSNFDFGINARESETLKYRQVATCSPLLAGSAGLVAIVNTTGTDLAASYPPGEVLYEYMFGPTTVGNYTYVHTQYERLYEQNYEITTLQYFPGVDLDEQEWAPNSTLYAAQDADVTISFLAANEIKYYYPVYDPLFSAGLDDNDTIIVPDGAKNETFYTSHHLVDVVGCIEQYQICITEGVCTPLVPLQVIQNATVALLKANNAENIGRIATLGRLSITSGSTGIGNPVLRRGIAVMLAPRSLNGVTQTARLPQNQWELEVENWFSIALAKMQSYMLSYAAGPEDPIFRPFVSGPVAAARNSACANQRVRNMEGNVNFNLSALIVLAVGGFVLIFIGLCFEPIVAWISKLNSSLRKRWAQYVSDGMYQIQRSSLEAQGVRNWKHEKDSLPTSSQLVEQAEPFEASSHESVAFVSK
ncbi:hypothetical protein DOTSEDRAFT_71279 [Dothistroma septosporum NZE10]|uniref:Uncharacterized protein n=1 Tax=Dothistroma septosporum (strain NZE10 / CBS 128990) TaxID=675120 RepID=N1PSX3_DOTSN|nr:hypothetical protein DOTSEDRAFT_71279 [Dothistroma septosporum NZE10]